LRHAFAMVNRRTEIPCCGGGGGWTTMAGETTTGTPTGATAGAALHAIVIDPMAGCGLITAALGAGGALGIPGAT